jgi:quaternary ammonium compound-resistance protein SugE
MSAISPAIALMVILSGALQIFAMSMLPMTRGLTEPLPTIGVAAGFLAGIGIMARITHAGINLSLLIPILAAVVPTGAILVGIFFYGEPASTAKICVLVGACMLIGLSNVV